VATTGLMTIEQFWELPETRPFYYELHHGKLVQVVAPAWHTDLAHYPLTAGSCMLNSKCPPLPASWIS